MDSPNDDEAAGSADGPDRPFERRATIGETPSASTLCHRWRPRSKSVSNACERCRRRKIRCDGETGPCSTCIRFCVACVRPPKSKERMGLGAHRALASRIQYLEAQLAEKGDGTPAWGDGIWNSTPSTPHPAQPPSLTVETSFDLPERSFSFDSGCTPQSDIPTIEISNCRGPSPTMLSPAPSLLSANSRCSTPEPYSITTPMMGSTLLPPMFGSPVSPPVSACEQPPWTHGDGGDDYLSPHGHNKPSSSRRSSTHSLGLDQDFNSTTLQYPAFDDEAQSPGGFRDPFRPQSQASHNSATPTPSSTTPKMPTKFEAETLSDIFFDRVDAAQRPVEHSFYQTCLELVFDLSPENVQGQEDTSLVELLIDPYSLRMARFFVFMTTAIGVRLRTGGRVSDSSLLDDCYRLAMRHAEAPSFWSEAGGVEAATLLTLFAKSGRDSHAVGGMGALLG